MRKLIVSNMVSADGYFEGPDHDISWFRIDPQFHHRHMMTLFDRIDTILLGRRTYELFLAYWPDKTKEDDEVAEFINHTKKIVVSTTIDKAPWGKWDDAALINNNLEEHVKSLKQERGGDIIVFGSGEIVDTLAKADLIDEYRLIICPAILGSGKQMITGKYLNQKLKLKAVTSNSFGVAIVDYERDR